MTTEDSGTPAATAEDRPDAELLRLAREIVDASASGNTAATDEEAEPSLDLATKLTHKLAEIPAHTLDGIIAKFDQYQRIHEDGAKSVWDDDLLRTIRDGLERLEPPANTDAKLFALEAEMKAAHEGYVTKGDEDYWYGRMDAAEKATLAISAKTPSDVAAKLRIFACYQDPPRDDDSVFTECIRNVIEDAQRIGGAS